MVIFARVAAGGRLSATMLSEKPTLALTIVVILLTAHLKTGRHVPDNGSFVN
jgi:hypothetical protein